MDIRTQTTRHVKGCPRDRLAVGLATLHPAPYLIACLLAISTILLPVETQAADNQAEKKKREVIVVDAEVSSTAEKKRSNKNSTTNSPQKPAGASKTNPDRPGPTSAVTPSTRTPSTKKTALPESNSAGELTTLGWLQSIRLLPHKVRFTAKLDTGAKTSSLHAINIEYFKRNRSDQVRFTVPFKKDGQESELTFELPLVKESRVKRHSSASAEVRPVVELDFCIDGQRHSALFSLDDRSQFNYPVLLGRRFLASRFVVDPSKKFLKRYHCGPVTTKADTKALDKNTQQNIQQSSKP